MRFWMILTLYTSLLRQDGNCLAEVELSPSGTVYAVINNPVKFTCKYKGTENATDIRWFLGLAVVANIRKDCSVRGGIPLEANYTCVSTEFYTFTILNVTNYMHDKEWYCQFTFRSDSAYYGLSEKATLYVKVPVQQVDFNLPTDDEITRTENETVKLRCTTSRERPRSTIRWFIDSQELLSYKGKISPAENDSLTETEGTITILVSREFNGKFIRCEANNMEGAEGVHRSSAKHFNVLYAPAGPTIHNYINHSTYMWIKSVTQSLTCSVTGGNPTPKVTWNCYNGAITLQIDTDTITKVVTWSTSDKKNGTCICSSTQDKLGTVRTFLDAVMLYSPSTPVFTANGIKFTETLREIVNNSVNVTCMTDSYPLPFSYKWTQPSSDTTDKNILQLLSVEESMKGVYQCTVTNMMTPSVGEQTLGSSQAEFKLDVLFKPKLTQIEDRRLIENENLTLNCAASSNPEPLMYTWTRTKDSFTQNLSTLTIPYTRREDTDIYICTVVNMMLPTFGSTVKGVSNMTVKVTVFYFPDVSVIHLNGTDVREGEMNVTLQCIATGEPTNYTFAEWIHYAPDGTTKIRSYTIVEPKKGSALLILQNVSYMDSGIFECTVSNGITHYKSNRLFATGRTILKVKGRPVATKRISTVAAGGYQNVSLSVYYYSYDTVNTAVTWYRIVNYTKVQIKFKENKTLFQTSTAVVNLTFHTVEVPQPGNKTDLLILNVSQSDFGDYEVDISNTIGKTVAKIKLTAKGAPDPPYRFLIVEGQTTSSSVELSWISGFHNGAEQTFLVQYNTSSTPWTDIAYKEGGMLVDTQFSTRIEKLIDNTQYFFRIFAMNKFGKSDFGSSILTVKTALKDGTAYSSSNTGVAIGGIVTGLVAAALITFGVLLLLRRYKKFIVCRKGHPSYEVDEDLDIHTYSNMSAQSSIKGSTRVAENMSTKTNTGSTTYESLASQSQSAAPYADLTTDIKRRPTGSPENVYDDLDAKKTCDHLYSSMQESQKESDTTEVVYSNLKITSS